MSKFIVASWNNGAAAKSLADALGCKLMRKDSTAPIPRSVTHVINLGIGSETEGVSRMMTTAAVVFNHPVAVHEAQSKVRTFGRVRTSILPPYWTDRTSAEYACLVEGHTVVARTLDRGSSGAGIVVLTPELAREGRGLPQAQLYTQGIDKRREYRVHIGHLNGSYCVIDVTRKIRRPGVDDSNRPFVWNHDNDFIFVRDGVSPYTIPRCLLQKAKQAVSDLSLTFGAVDIVVQRGGRILEAACYVLEVNTSPGMEGITLDRYVQFFNAKVGNTEMITGWGNLTPEGDVSNPEQD